MDRRTALRTLLLLFLGFGISGPSFAQYTVSTYAVAGAFGSFDGFGLTVDNSGNVYATGEYPVNNVGFQGHAVFEIRAGLVVVGLPRTFAVAGASSTIPGASFAQGCPNVFSATGYDIDNPDGLAVDNSGRLYIAQGGGGPGILRLSNRSLSAVPGSQNCNGSATSTTVDNSGNVFIGVVGAVYKVSPGGVTSTVAGNASPGCSGGEIGRPLGLAADINGNVYVADELCDVIWKIPASGPVVPFAGKGSEDAGCTVGAALSATLSGPSGVAADQNGDIFIADTCGVRMVRNDTVTTIATVEQLGSSGQGPHSIAVGPGGVVYAGMANGQSSQILAFTPPGGGIYCPSVGGVLPGTSVTFCWTSGGTGAQYELDVSDKIGPIGQGDFFVGTTAALSETVSDLPCDGRFIYVQLATNGQTSTRRYTYTACQMLRFSASPNTLPNAGGTVALTAQVFNLSRSTQTVYVSIFRNLPESCHRVRLGLGGWITVCTPGISVELTSETLTIPLGSSQSLSVNWATGVLPSAESSASFNFSANVTTASGTVLDTASTNVTQN